jgi:hypothetical protein
MGLRSYIASRFGKSVKDTPDSLTDADRAVEYCGIVTVGPEFYDPPDDPWLAGMARGASRAFSDRTLTEQPPFHSVRYRREGQQDRDA